MIWHAMPPEINTSRLMAGAGPAPMLQAAAGWEVLAISLETQADELAGSLAALSSVWSGSASERAAAAIMPMVVWLRTVSLQAQKRVLQATAQATAYTAALTTTPPIPEIELNHVTRAVLHATNFLNVNAAPIGVNEVDYFVRMWNQAAGAMDVYQAETALNIVFEPIMPMKPIVMPGVGEAAVAGALGKAAAMAPAAAARNLTFTKVSAQATVESAALQGGRAVAQGNMAAQRAEGAVQKSDNLAQQAGQQTQQGAQQGMQMGMQMGMQLGSTLGQLPQQVSQLISQPMQQLTQPLQQVTSMFSSMGMGGERSAQIGLYGASPFSNHPITGGGGPASGAGLVRAASLPGAGGSPPMTSLIANLVGSGNAPAPSAGGAMAGGAGAGIAPIGGGMGGGGAPMGAMGQNSKSGGSKSGLKAPAPLVQDLDEDEGDDW